MPELPEVETVLRTIWPVAQGRAIRSAQVLHPGVLDGCGPAEFERALTGRRFVTARRRGKYLVFGLAAGPLAGPPCLHVLVHLGMTGKLTSAEPACPDLPHTHLRLGLEGGLELRYADARRFGRWRLVGGGVEAGAVPGGGGGGDGEAGQVPPGYRRLGPEPLEPGLDPAALAVRLAARRGRLKPALLDQRLVAGIGNIYADEMLHRAGLHPERPAGTLEAAEVARLHAAMVAVLEAAIGDGGTTIRDYVNGRGQPGDFVYSLRVYGRTGQPCLTCGGRGAVIRIVVAGRSTHLCPACQPWPGESRP